MKAPINRVLIISLLILALCLPAAAARAQGEMPDTTPPVSTNPVTPPQDSSRPIIVIQSYYLDKDTISPGDSFNLFLSLKNEGKETAHNLIFTFAGDGLLPQETGGVVALNEIGGGGTAEISQRFIASSSLWGQSNVSLPVALTYNSPTGEPFSATFNLTLGLKSWNAGTWATATPTPTSTALPRPQLVVSGYRTDVDPLQPGTIFNLELDVRNMGSGDARDITMVLGGGGSSMDPNASGTPQPGGVSGGSSDLSVFAPIESSNLVYLDDLGIGSSKTTSQKLIVNVNANPGAYALKLSFVYNDALGNRLVDDQVITLLIYQMPQVEVNFYRDPGTIFAMQPNTLPIQVVNLGRKSAVMGNITVTAENADLMNNVMLVGTLEMGGYFPLDVMLIPHNPGTLDLQIAINYTDDFNQPRTITKTLQLDVMESMPIDPGMPGDPGMGPGGAVDPGMGNEFPVDMPVEETFWQKVLRFFKGLFGLDSGPVQPKDPIMSGDMPQNIMPEEGMPVLPLQ